MINNQEHLEISENSQVEDKPRQFRTKEILMREQIRNETKQQLEKQQTDANVSEIHREEGVTQTPFVYKLKGKEIEFKCTTENYAMKCPHCHIESRYIVQHISKNTNCQKKH